MALNPTLRVAKGSPLTYTEVDGNFELLAQDATKTQQGNVEIADQAETEAFASETLAVSPSTLATAMATLFEFEYNAGTSSTEGEIRDKVSGFSVKWGQGDTGGNTTDVINFVGIGLHDFDSAEYAVSLANVENGDTFPTTTLSAPNRATTGFTIYTNVNNKKVSWIAVGIDTGTW